MSQSKRLEGSEVDWQRFAASFTPPDYTEAVIAAAISRLENGDVISTRYGIRVQVRPDLGDYHPSGADAFLPEEDHIKGPWCACDELKDRGMCSHVLAARIYRAWLSFYKTTAIVKDEEDSVYSDHSATEAGGDDADGLPW